MAAPTKTVELPLTKSEQRHLENTRRRDAKRARAAGRHEAKHDRDKKLAEINASYAPKIEKLQTARRRELDAVWKAWRDTRSRSEEVAPG